jgi:hypothetical protein
LVTFVVVVVVVVVVVDADTREEFKDSWFG